MRFRGAKRRTFDKIWCLDICCLLVGLLSFIDLQFNALI
jgi:hypothetical protein